MTDRRFCSRRSKLMWMTLKEGSILLNCLGILLCMMLRKSNLGRKMRGFELRC
jgi:hypothetical protein